MSGPAGRTAGGRRAPAGATPIPGAPGDTAAAPPVPRRRDSPSAPRPARTAAASGRGAPRGGRGGAGRAERRPPSWRPLAGAALRRTRLPAPLQRSGGGWRGGCRQGFLPPRCYTRSCLSALEAVLRADSSTPKAGAVVLDLGFYKLPSAFSDFSDKQGFRGS